jgi:site-specific DNA recombinase
MKDMKGKKVNVIEDNYSSDLSVFAQFEQNPGKRKPVIQKEGSECAVGYTRVSSKEQYLTNGSLETQLRLINGLSKSRNIPVLEFFGGTFESAKSEERKEFKRMMDFVAKSRKNIKYIFVSDHDRFSRSGANAIHIASQLRSKGIQLVAASSPVNTLNPTGALHQDMMLLFSAYDNSIRREKCSRGMKQKYEKGLYFGKPPLGYNCVRVNNESRYIPNEKGKLLGKAFKWKADGKLASIEIVKRLNKLGLAITDKKLSWVFRNVFYCGLLKNNMLENVIEGKNWEPIVTKEVFLEANNELSKRREKFESHKEDTAVPLRHAIHCDKCGRPLTAYLVKRKNLYYYKCNTLGCKSNKSVKQMHADYEQLLFQLGIDKKYAALVRKQLRASLVKYDASLKEREADFQKSKKALQMKMDKLEEKLVNDEISKELFEKFMLKYKNEMEELNKENPMQGGKLSNLDLLVDKAIEKSQNLSQYWVSASFSKKKAIQKAIFPGKVYYHTEKGTYRTTEVNKALSYIAGLARVSGDLKQKSPSKKSKDSCRVEDTGVEPVTSCMPCKRSSQMS